MVVDQLLQNTAIADKTMWIQFTPLTVTAYETHGETLHTLPPMSAAAKRSWYMLFKYTIEHKKNGKNGFQLILWNYHCDHNLNNISYTYKKKSQIINVKHLLLPKIYLACLINYISLLYDAAET